MKEITYQNKKIKKAGGGKLQAASIKLQAPRKSHN